MTRARPTTKYLAAAALVVMTAACDFGHGGGRTPAPAAGAPGACTTSPPRGGPPQPMPTTVDTLEQAYRCVLAHYYDHAALDDRGMLNGAVAGLTQELGKLGLDQPGLAGPGLTGNRDRDWKAFAAVYRRATDRLPADPAVRQRVAAATMNGMLHGLNDNHAYWSYPAFPPGYQPGDAYGLGLFTSPMSELLAVFPDEALPPVFVTSVIGGPA